MHTIIFDLKSIGHHPNYIRQLLLFYPDLPKSDHQVSIVVSPQFMVEHKDILSIPTKVEVQWISITPREFSRYEWSQRSLALHAWVEWQLFCRYAAALDADHGLVMFIDRFQLPLAFQLPAPCTISGIYFRPRFHYAQMGQGTLSIGEKMRAVREKWLWKRALQHPRLKTLFLLDSLAVEPYRVLSRRTEIVHLSDPVTFNSTELAVLEKINRTTLEIATHRKVFLLFGVIEERKGIYLLLRAVEQLPDSCQEQITLLIVGRVAPEDSERLQNAIQHTRQATSIQLIFCDEFVPEEKIPVYFSLADLVLAPYQRHIGSSGILLLAAAAGKPVLAADYGLMGYTVQKWRLGLAIDTTSSSEIAQGICTFLDQEQLFGFDPEMAWQFASENSSEAYAQTIWGTICVAEG